MYEKQVPMSPKTRMYRWLALLAWVALLSLVAYWQMMANITHSYSLFFVVTLYLLPLFLPMAGIILAKPYTHAWASFVVLLYLMHGITVAYAVPEEFVLGMVEILLSSAMFVGCSVFARLRGRELGLSLPKLKDVMEREKQFFEGQ